jgi:hypothetical protein
MFGDRILLTLTCLVWGATLAACGGGGPGVDPDGGIVDAGGEPDAPQYAACREVRDPQLVVNALPLAVAGDLAGAGADMEAPIGCEVVDAPFGMSSPGADFVIEIQGLEADTDYVVRLDAADDLAFYVVTDCGTPTGPAARECLLFEDAQTDAPEVGHFRLPHGQDRAFVVVDYYAAGYPAATDFMAQVYATECDTSVQCGGETPVCQDGRCTGCGTDFDCLDADAPLCDEPTYTCVAGASACLGDDVHENGDDGPAGASALAPGAPVSGAICDSPSTERDFTRFQVLTDGEDWTIQLDWASSADLDLIVYDAAGQPVGMSFYEQPERIDLTYLPAGEYYAAVDYFTQSGTSLATPYTISATSTPDACTSTADCAVEHRNQLFRGTCAGGACERIEGDGALPPGARCDSVSDCASGSSCASFFFTSDADTRMVCGNDCAGLADCAALGSDYICANYVFDSFCVQKCTSDDQCPALPGVTPTTPPWLRYRCQVATGQCIDP